MHSNTASSKPVALGASLTLLVAAACLLRPLESRLATQLASRGLRPGQWEALAAHGGVLAVLGGIRAAVASGFWLRANLAWEHRDSAATAAFIALTVAADERPVYYWVNGARILAFDLPEWTLPGQVPAALRQRTYDDHARQALGFLEQAVRWHGPDPAIYVEMGNIHLRRTNDLENAARCYRLAAEQPGAPYYAARIHGELLRELGQTREALAWMRQVLPRLPANDPAACREVVIDRIRALERELGIE